MKNMILNKNSSISLTIGPIIRSLLRSKGFSLRFFTLIVACLMIAIGFEQAEGETFTFDFNTGPGPNFSINNTGNLFNVDTDGPSLRIFKPADDGTLYTDSFISAGIKSNFTCNGNFTVTVDFTLDNFPAIPFTHQLNESILGIYNEDNSQFFLVLRFRLSHQNLIEVFTKGHPLGVTTSTLITGRYRISRSGSIFTGQYAPSGSSTFTTIASDIGFSGPVKLRIFGAQGRNVVGANRSTTALDISFDNLVIEADQCLGVLIPAEIDIKPDSDSNSINLSSAGVIPVAILSSDTFDATTVIPESVALAGARVKMVGKAGKYLCSDEDVNEDGFLDKVCKVYTAQFMIEVGESVAVLEAETSDGRLIRGEDNVNIVPD
jgi:hypothetical protein